jgi:hypothetical protein
MQAIALAKVNPIVFFYFYEACSPSLERVHITSYTIQE